MRIRSLLITSLFCSALALAPRVLADDKSHRAAVLELCSVMDIERLMQDSMNRMIDVQLQQAPNMQSARPKFEKFFGKYLSWNALKEDFIKLYMESFTEAELRELVTFYKTPTGQKAVRQMPVLLQRGAEIGATRVREHMNELMQMLSSSEPDQTKPAPAKPAPLGSKPSQPPAAKNPASPIH